MTQLTLNIPEKKLPFFFELIKQLGIEIASKDESKEIVIPEWQKDIVRERRKNTSIEEMIPWEEARKQLNFKVK